MRKSVLLACCLAFSVATSWASLVGTTDAALFPYPVNWCQLGCLSAPEPTPSAWTSASHVTGLVGLVNTGQDFYNLVQGLTWAGDFSSGEGVIYNGAGVGNTPTDIAADFNSPVLGVGAYIDPRVAGPFTATITLFDASFLPIGSFTTTGTATSNPGTALFIGAYDTTTPVWAVQFDAVGTGPDEPDFAIGTMFLNSVPEPSFLFVLPAIGLAGTVLRRRALKKS